MKLGPDMCACGAVIDTDTHRFDCPRWLATVHGSHAATVMVQPVAGGPNWWPAHLATMAAHFGRLALKGVPHV